MIKRLLATVAVCAAVSAGVLCETLDSLPTRKDFTAHRESSHDRGGGNLDMRPIAPGDSLTIADIEGPGTITHLWCTFMYPGRQGLRNLVLRAWFDGADTPCVEAPLGDFFGLGHNLVYTYSSEALAVGSNMGLNNYWKMPFARHARLTVSNEGRTHCPAFYFYVDYQRHAKPQPDMLCFHAIYRQAMPCRQGEPYVLMEARGPGHFVGCNLSIEQLAGDWWGEGDDRFFVDGETTPSIVGTGSEDYFGGAWCYKEEFSFPCIGTPLRGRFHADGKFVRSRPDLSDKDADEWRWPSAWQKGDLWNVYRHHIQDPVPFRKSLRVEIEHGYRNNEREDAYSSVAYWYQAEPHGPQPRLVDARDRKPYFMRPQERANGVCEMEDYADETTCTGGQVIDVEEGFWRDLCSRDHRLEWDGAREDDILTLPLDVEKAGSYRVELHALRTRGSGIFDIGLDGSRVGKPVDLSEPSVFPAKQKIALGRRELASGTHVLEFRCKGRGPGAEGTRLLLDYVQLSPSRAADKDNARKRSNRR